MKKKTLIIRSLSGISGDMILTGLLKLSDVAPGSYDVLLRSIGVHGLEGCLKIGKVRVGGISGWRAKVSLGHSHEHRAFGDIRVIIRKSGMAARAKKIALGAFSLLAGTEARIHGVPAGKIEFHEIGGLDSVLDICGAAVLYDKLGFGGCYCSPLPLCDGVIRCAHGLLSSPAPATLELLGGVRVRGLDSRGETVTPTAIALLKAFGTKFGKWPAVTIEKSVRVYGSRVLPNVPNGAIFVSGRGPVRENNERTH